MGSGSLLWEQQQTSTTQSTNLRWFFFSSSSDVLTHYVHFSLPFISLVNFQRCSAIGWFPVDVLYVVQNFCKFSIHEWEVGQDHRGNWRRGYLCSILTFFDLKFGSITRQIKFYGLVNRCFFLPALGYWIEWRLSTVIDVDSIRRKLCRRVSFTKGSASVDCFY